jgi:hypothetical protein
MVDPEIWSAVHAHDAKGLCKLLFNEEPTETQAGFIKEIAFGEHKRIVICAHTRYGKTYSVALAVLLYVLFNEKKKIGLIAPIREQTGILRNYIADFCIQAPIFRSLIDLDLTGLDRLKKEVSKNRITFKNGCSLQVLSAEGEATRLMGWGFDLVILDESCLIDAEVYRQKISRMLGDSADAMLVEIGNPWNRNNHFYKHWMSPEFLKIHIGFETGLQEGRITQEFVEEQSKVLTANEFRILYEARFPEESEDALLRTAWIEEALKRKFDFDAAIKKEVDIRKIIEGKLKIGEGEPTILPELIKAGIEQSDAFQMIRRVKEKDTTPLIPVPKIVMGLDVAEMGLDSTVLTVCRTFENKYELIAVHAWDKKDTMVTAGKVDEFCQKYNPSMINVDATGVGSGVASRLQEMHWPARAIKVGESPTNERAKGRFRNKKAEFYWTLRDVFEQGNISIIESGRLIEELSSMRYEFGSTRKVQIVDPEKSPDYSDSLMLCLNTSTGFFAVVV